MARTKRWAHYTDDNTPYVSGDSIDDVTKSFEDHSINFLNGF